MKTYGITTLPFSTSHSACSHMSSLAGQVDGVSGYAWTATLDAATLYGAYHGLETFAQLIRFDFAAQACVNPTPTWDM